MQQPVTLPPSVAVMSAKGGVGRSWVAQALALIAVFKGINTVLVDLDMNLTQVRMFRQFLELAHAPHIINGILCQNNIILGRVAPPTTQEVQQGHCEVLIDIPLRFIAQQLITTTTTKSSHAGDSIFDPTNLAKYMGEHQIEPERLGRLVVTNQLEALSALQSKAATPQLTTRRTRRTRRRQGESFDIETMPSVVEALPAPPESQGGMIYGNPAISAVQSSQIVIVDSPGQRGEIQSAIFTAVQHVIVPFTTSRLSVDGALNTARDTTAARRRREEGSAPRVMFAIANMYNDDPDEEFDEWITEEVEPEANEVLMPVHGVRVPLSADIKQTSGREGVIPFLSCPEDPALQALETIADDLFIRVGITPSMSLASIS